MSYRSKVDVWVAVLFVVAVALPAAIWLRIAELTMPMVAVLLIPLAFLIVLVLRTSYRLDEAELEVACGFMHWRIPLRDIRSVRATRNLWGAPALSLDRFEINWTGGDVLISPKNQRGFLVDLTGKAPWVKVLSA